MSGQRPLLVIADPPVTAGDFREIPGGGGDPGTSPGGYRIEWADDGEQGIALVTRGLDRQSPYPVALVDQSPSSGESWVETVERLWEADPRLQVVLCTAGGEAGEAAERFRGDQRLLLLKKPVSPLEVVQSVGILAAKWELERRSEQLGELQALAQRRGDALDTLTADLERARREADAALQAKRELLAAIEKELKGPLNTVLGMADLALLAELPASQRGLLVKVREAAQALGEKVGAVLDTAGPAGETVSLPGVSIALGLEYCGDDRELLRSLMEKFLRRREATAEIADLLARGNREEAQRAAHTLISPAATIGADLLARAARAMEEGIRDRDGDRLPPLLERLGRELNRVMGSLDRYLAQQPNQAGPGGPDRARVKGLLEQMTSLFESDLGAALSVKDELRRELRGSHLFEQFCRLEHLVDSFDFNGAAKARERLEEMLESAPAVPEEKP
ncbi:hypothetical protein GMSM_23250 [Geomonas sp. Red276]